MKLWINGDTRLQRLFRFCAPLADAPELGFPLHPLNARLAMAAPTAPFKSSAKRAASSIQPAPDASQTP